MVSSADDVQDFVFLGEARPVLIRMYHRVDGKSVQAAWDDFLKYLFAGLGVNGDGALSKEEAERVPAADQILSGGLGRVGPFGRGQAVAGPSLDVLDADKDGKVTPAELTAYYRQNGFALVQVGSAEANPLGGAMVILGGSRAEPPVAAVSAAAFALLDADKDGKLTKEELAAAPAALLRLDDDDDEIVTARDLAPDANPPPNLFAPAQMMAGPGKTGSAAGLKNLVPLATPGEATPALVRSLQEQYGPLTPTPLSPGKGERGRGEGADKPEEKRLSRKDLGLDEATFRRLDTDGDGVLDATELAGFVKRTPDLDLDATRLELRTAGADGPDRFGGIVRQQSLAQMMQADANGDGVIDEGEAKNSRAFRSLFKMMDRDGDGKVTDKGIAGYFEQQRELQARGRAAVVSLTLADQSRGLFDLLDVNRDGRLSVREMRSTAGLLEKLDRDGKGHLTKADLPRSYQLTLKRGSAAGGGLDPAAAFAALYGGADRAEPEAPRGGPAWFRKMDRNRDGDVSPKEFLFSAEQFRKIDADGDGLLSAAEAERYEASLRKRP